jgi:hypothetical protein
MDTMKTVFITRFIPAIFLTAFLTSCFENEIKPDALGDAYILVEMNGQDTLKGLGLHAFSYYEFATVTASLTGNANLTYTLAPYLNYPQDFLWITPSGQFSKNLPSTGDYVFSAAFKEGQSLVFYDKLTADIISPPKVTECAYSKSTLRINLSWDVVKNANLYNVKLYDLSGKLLFVSEVLGANIKSFSFGSDSQGWQATASTPENGQSVIVEINAYLLEFGKTTDELQCISKSRNQIVWGS